MLINSENFSKLVGSVILLICCFMSIVSIFKKVMPSFAKKALGALLIIGVALFSNHIITYSIAIIIIGTLIADSKFLENIWATIFKNKDYFVSNATEEQKRKKALDEINSEAPISIENIEKLVSTKGNLTCDGNSYDERIKQIIEFKNEIRSVLASSNLGLFKSTDISFDVVISNSLGENTIIDAVAKDKETNFYCIEIKQSCSLASLNNNIEQLRKNVKILNKYYKNKCLVAKVKGILVVPENCAPNDNFYDDFAILKYNKDTKSFLNRETVLEWI